MLPPACRPCRPVVRGLPCILVMGEAVLAADLITRLISDSPSSSSEIFQLERLPKAFFVECGPAKLLISISKEIQHNRRLSPLGKTRTSRCSRSLPRVFSTPQSSRPLAASPATQEPQKNKKSPTRIKDVGIAIRHSQEKDTFLYCRVWKWVRGG